jgi:hypothetical protein
MLRLQTLLLAATALPFLMGAQVSFTNQNASLSNSGFHSGVAIGVADMNGDGLDDIVRLGQARVLNIEYQTPNGGAFVNFLHGSISNSNQWSLCIADVDNDGFNDIFSGGSYDGAKIIRANATGTAYTVSVLPGPNLFVQGSNFADINQDGFADVFACHDDAESRIWANNGDGTFSQADEWIDMATVPPSDNSGNYGSVWTDFDNDGDLDLYIAKCRQGVNNPNDPRRINALFVNDGNNNFTEAAGDYGLKIGAQSWTADFGDIDNDGDMDCFITNHDVASQLLENDGSGHFTDITSSSGLAIGGLAIQGVFRDFDNDGFVDVLVAGTQQYLYRNNGNKTFSLVPNPFNANQMESYAIGDLNHDGFLDIYGGYANIYTTPSNIDDVLWMNTANDNNWLAVNLVGTISNRNAIGARLELYGPWGLQIREVRAGESYGIMNSYTQHFGLGTHETIDSLIVKWPNGLIETFQPQEANQFITVIENNCIAPVATITPDGPTTICSGEEVTLSAPEGFFYHWSNDEITQSVTITEAGIYNVTISDAGGCFGISTGVQIVVDPQEIPSIAIEGDTIFCAGGSVTLTSSEAAAYAWPNGENTQSITVSESGIYAVTIQGLCGPFTSTGVVVDVYEIDAPAATADPDTITAPASVLLSATGANPQWYDQPEGGNLLGTGNTFQTPELSETTTFYVEDLGIFAGGVATGGMPEHSGASQFGGNQFNGQLIFDCLSPFTLKQVKVYTDTPGPRVVQLYDENDQLLASKQAGIPAGENQVFLDFEVQPGANLYLTTDQTFNLNEYGYESPRLRRNNSGVMYPYEIAGAAILKNSNFGEDYYYYFYNWQIELPGDSCTSERVPVEVFYKDISSAKEPITRGLLRAFPNPASGSFQLELPAGSQYLSIWDAQGRMVKGLDLNGTQGSLSVETTTWPAGNYLVQVIGDNSVYRLSLSVY